MTGEHPICGETWESEADATPAEALADAARWCCQHQGCRCVAELPSDHAETEP